MKHTSKILIALLVLATMLMSLTVLTAGAEETATSNPNVLNFSDMDTYARGAKADGETEVINSVYTIIHSSGSRLEGNSKTFDDGFKSTNRFDFNGKVSAGKVPTKAALKISLSGASNIKVWWVGGGADRCLTLLDSTGAEVKSFVAADNKTTIISEFTNVASGTYYLCSTVGNNYWFKVEATPYCTHANTEAIPAVDATCTEAGAGVGTKCSDCGAVITAPEVVDALGHDGVLVDAKAATCIATGNNAYYDCSRCDKYFTDAECTIETTVADETIKMVPHSYGEDNICTTPDCGAIKPDCEHPNPIAATCQAGAYCPDCESTISTPNPDNHIPGAAATCTTAQLCTGCEAQIAPALDHDMQDVAAQASTCLVKGWEAYQQCSRCDHNTKVELALAPHTYDIEHSTVDKEPTCTVIAERTYTCTLDGCTATKKETVLYAHEYDANNKCTKCGVTAYIFDATEFEAAADKEAIAAGVYGDYFTIGGTVKKRFNNGAVYAAELEKKSTGWIEITLDHKATVVVFFSSTGGSNNSFINMVPVSGGITGDKIFATDKEVVGTTYIYFEVELDAGTYRIVCPDSQRNTRVSKVAVFEADHAYTENTDAYVAPSCTEAGSKTYVCACGASYNEPVASTGHNFANDWSNDGDNHWHACQNTGCTEISGSTAHEFATDANGDNACTACGYVVHVHQHTVAQSDATHHWNKCSSCDDTTEKVAHTWDREVTCTEGKSCACGYTVAALGHSYENGACSVCQAPDYNYDHIHVFTPGLVTPGTDKGEIEVGTEYADFFKIHGVVTQRNKSGAVYAVEVGKNGTGGIMFTVESNAVITVSFSSTGGENISAVGLIDARGNVILADDKTATVTGTGATNLTFTVKAGTYYVASPESEYNRGARVLAVNVTYKLCEHTYAPGHIDPNCLYGGGDANICSKCNHTVYTSEEAALGHAWNEGSVTTAPTCTEKGEKTYTCTRCNETKVEEVEATGHNYVDGKCACGAEDPDYVAPDPQPDPQPEPKPEPQPEPELNIFQKIWLAIVNFFKGIGNFFKNLFSGKKN